MKIAKNILQTSLSRSTFRAELHFGRSTKTRRSTKIRSVRASPVFRSPTYVTRITHLFVPTATAARRCPRRCRLRNRTRDIKPAVARDRKYARRCVTGFDRSSSRSSEQSCATSRAYPRQRCSLLHPVPDPPWISKYARACRKTGFSGHARAISVLVRNSGLTQFSSDVSSNDTRAGPNHPRKLVSVRIGITRSSFEHEWSNSTASKSRASDVTSGCLRREQISFSFVLTRVHLLFFFFPDLIRRPERLIVEPRKELRGWNHLELAKVRRQ